MAGDIWEQAVETYLAMDRGLFLSPQYLIGEPKEWEANADFLAIVFPEQKIWMVEVTKRPGGKIREKIDKFQSNYAPRIRAQLERNKVITGTGWDIGLWLFLPGSEAQKYENTAKVTALEETLKPTAWDTRFR